MLNPKTHYFGMTVGFACSNAYPVFNYACAPNTLFGGMETRSVTLAKALAKNKHLNLIFVVDDFGQDDKTVHDGVTCVIYQKTFTKAIHTITTIINYKGSRYKNYFSYFHLMWLLFIVLAYQLIPSILMPIFWRMNKCDVICCFGVNAQSHSIINECNRLGIKTILFIASDSDLSDKYYEGATGHNKFNVPNSMCYAVVMNAGNIIVQTQKQLSLLRTRFGREADILPNPVNSNFKETIFTEKKHHILWVGRADEFHKRPHLCIEVAKNVPQAKFIMILNNTDGVIFDKILTQKPDNVEIIEQVPFDEMPSYFRQAKFLLSTSNKDYEGFPNTFLQAGCLGVPLVTLEVDPDNVFSAAGGAFNAHGNIFLLIEKVKELNNNNEEIKFMGDNIKKYVLENHDIDSTTKKLTEILYRIKKQKK